MDENVQGLPGVRTNETGDEIINTESLSKAQTLALKNKQFDDAIWSGVDYGSNDYLLENPVGVHRMENDGSLLSSYGSSKYDDEILVNPTDDIVQNKRFDKQSGAAQIGLGLTKGVVLAGTTFLDGIATLTLGLGEGVIGAINAENGDYRKLNAFGEGLWNNEVSKSMQAINEWAEDTFKNYYSTDQERGPWYSANNLISANFLGDKILKNMGFMVGAFYSGALVSKVGLLPKMMKAITQSNKVAKSTAAVTGSLVSAINEGSIEALNNSTEWKKAETEKLNLETQQEITDLEKIKSFLTPEEYELRKERINQSYQETLAKIDEDAIRMGNMDLLLNIPILTAENIFAWGRLYSQGYKNATRLSEMRKNINHIRNGETRTVLGKIENKIKHPRWEGTKSTLKRSIAEGNEEMAQGWASEFAGNRESQDVLAYYKAKLNDEAYERNIDNWKASAEAWHNTYGNGDRWEEFAIGAISSIFGMPKIRGVKNKETGKFQLPISFEGGIREDFRKARENQAKAQKIVDYVNDRLENPKFQKLLESATGHEYWQAIMDDAAAKGDKKMFKDAESAQFINDLFMFHQAGMLDGLEEVIKAAGDLSDIESETGRANLDLIKENDKVYDKDGKVVGSQRGFHQLDKATGEWISKPDEDIVNDIKDRRDKLLAYIKDYRNTVESLDYTTNGVLSDDQLKELTWYKMRSKDAGHRIGDMAKGLKTKKLDSDPDVSEISTFINDRIKALSEKKDLTKEEQSELETLNKHSQAVQAFLDEDFKKVDQNINKYRDVVSDFGKAINYVGEKMGNNKTQNYKSVVSEMNDIVSLFSDIDKYNFLYSAYLSNPGLLEQQIEDLKKQQELENIKKVAKGIEEKLINAKNQQEFRGMLTQELNALKDSSSNPSEKEDWYIQQVEEQIKKSENPFIKQMYNEMTTHKNLVEDILTAKEQAFDYALKNWSQTLLPDSSQRGLYNILNSIFSDKNLDSLTDFNSFKSFINRKIKYPPKEGNEYKNIMPGLLNAVLTRVEQLQAQRNASEKKENPNPQEPNKGGSTASTKGTSTTSTTSSKSTKNENFGITGSEEMLESAKENYDAYVKSRDAIAQEIQNKNLNNAVVLSSELETNAKLFLLDIDKASNDKDKWHKAIDKELKAINDGIDRLRAEVANEGLAAEEQNVDEPFTVDDDIADDTEPTPEQQQQVEEQHKAIVNETIADMDRNATPTKATGLLNQAKSWLFTWWNFDKLQEKEKRRKTKYVGIDEKTKKELPTPKVVEFLHDSNSFEFVDRGGLADLNALHKKNHDGKNIPLHFACVSEANEKDYNNVIICIEATEEVNSHIGKHYKGTEPKTIESGGKKYIPVGVVSYYKGNVNSEAVRNNIVNTVTKEYQDAGSPNIFVSSYTSEVSHFYSGRFVLTDDEHTEVKNRFLRETIFKDPTKLIFGIGRRNREVRAPQLGTARPKLLNDNVPLDMRAGSVWIMVKGSDGVNYPLGTRVLRFNEKEYNWRNHQQSPIIQKIRERLAVVLDSNASNDARMKARDAIGKYIAFPTKPNGDKHIVFGEGVGEKAGEPIASVVSLSGKSETLVLSKYDDINQRIDAFLDLLMRFNYKFNVDVQELKASGKELTDYLNMIIESDIITTPLITDHNVCGSFELSVLKDKDGNIVSGKAESEKPNHASPATGINNHKHSFMFKYNGKDYTVMRNNDKDKKGFEIDDDIIRGAAEAAWDTGQNPNTPYKQHKNVWFYVTNDGKGPRYIVDRTNNQPVVYDVSTQEGQKLLETWNYYEKKENPETPQTPQTPEQKTQTDTLEDDDKLTKVIGKLQTGGPTEIKIPEITDDNGNLIGQQVFKQKIYVEVLSDGRLKETRKERAQYIVYDMGGEYIYVYNSEADVEESKSNFNSTFDNVSNFSGASQAERFFSTKEGTVQKDGSYFKIVQKTEVYGKPKETGVPNTQPTVQQTSPQVQPQREISTSDEEVVQKSIEYLNSHNSINADIIQSQFGSKPTQAQRVLEILKKRNIIDENWNKIKPAEEKSQPTDKPKVGTKTLKPINTKHHNTARGIKPAPVVQTPQTVIDKLAGKFGTYDSNGELISYEKEVIENLVELSKFATLTVNMDENKLNELAEKFENCNGLRHMRFWTIAF